MGMELLTLAPARAPTWLFGAPGGVQVWTVYEAAPFVVSVLIRPGLHVVLLAARVAGTSREGEAIRWALERLADSPCGYYELSVT